MRQKKTHFEVRTRGPGLYELTSEVVGWCSASKIREGLLTVYIRHTSASLTIQENADPDVLQDLESFFERIVSRDPVLYRHRMEGPDDMPAHIRSALPQPSLSIPVDRGRPVLGTWQGIFLYEHRDLPHARHVAAHLIGKAS
mgnify:FL=1